MGKLHIFPQGYHWMEFGHEERDAKIIEGTITILLTAGMLILAYYMF